MARVQVDSAGATDAGHQQRPGLGRVQRLRSSHNSGAQSMSRRSSVCSDPGRNARSSAAKRPPFSVNLVFCVSLCPPRTPTAAPAGHAPPQRPRQRGAALGRGKLRDDSSRAIRAASATQEWTGQFPCCCKRKTGRGGRSAMTARNQQGHASDMVLRDEPLLLLREPVRCTASPTPAYTASARR